MAVKKWDYMCQRVPHDYPGLEKGLDKLGEDGWELVGTEKVRTAISPASEVLILFFKREREIPEPIAKDPNTLAVVGRNEPDYKKANSLPPAPEPPIDQELDHDAEEARVCQEYLRSIA